MVQLRSKKAGKKGNAASTKGAKLSLLRKKADEEKEIPVQESDDEVLDEEEPVVDKGESADVKNIDVESDVDESEEENEDESEEENEGESEEESESEGESEEENTMDVKLNLKRKQVEKTKVKAKKSKVDNSTSLCTTAFYDLPEDLDDSSFKDFLKEKNIKPAACRFNSQKRLAFVDVMKDDVKKVLELNQTEFLSSKISVSMDSYEKFSKPRVVTVAFMDLPEDLDDSSFKDFLDEKNINPAACRFNSQKRWAFVDVMQDELKKALLLDQTEFLSNKISVSIDARVKFSKPRVVTVAFMDLPEDLDDSSFKDFLDEKNINPAACRFDSEKRCAFVEIKEDEVKKALVLDQTEFLDSKISVSIDTTEKNAKTTDIKEKDSRTIFCKNVPFRAKEKDIADLFEGVKSVKLFTVGGRPTGKCFIEFNTVEEKEATLALKEEVELDGRSLLLESYDRERKNKPASSRTLFIKGITEDMNKDLLLSTFDGAINARIPQDRETGQNKFFGYVEFESEDKAKFYYDSSKDGINIYGNTVKVTYAEAKGRRGGGGGSRGRGGRFGRGRGRGGRYNKR